MNKSLRFEQSEAIKMETVVGARLSHVTKEFTNSHEQARVLSDVTLEVRTRETLAVVGPSGSGKSTLLYCLGAMLRPTTGDVFLNDVPVWKMTDKKRSRLRASQVGFVFQASHLLADLSVLENCLLPMKILGERVDRDKVYDCLDAMGLGPLATRRPNTLSGGEKQRVAICRAIVNEPELLLCDEPTGNLDQANAENILDILFELDPGKVRSLVIVTHNPDVANRADRIVRLENGVIQ
jgi:ABC-type lipoprotein export system ATPase subunit